MPEKRRPARTTSRPPILVMVPMRTRRERHVAASRPSVTGAATCMMMLDTTSPPTPINDRCG